MKTVYSLTRQTLTYLIASLLLVTACSKSNEQKDGSSGATTSSVNQSDKIDSSGGQYYDSTLGNNPKNGSNSSLKRQ